MLLNRCLTVRPGSLGLAPWPGLGAGHAARIEALARRGGPCVAILWGATPAEPQADARRMPYVESAHPSPLSAHRGFFGSRPFSRVNALLVEQGATEVDWRLPME